MGREMARARIGGISKSNLPQAILSSSHCSVSPHPPDVLLITDDPVATTRGQRPPNREYTRSPLLPVRFFDRKGHHSTPSKYSSTQPSITRNSAPLRGTELTRVRTSYQLVPFVPPRHTLPFHYI